MTVLEHAALAKLKTVTAATVSNLLLKRGLRNVAVRGVRSLGPLREPMVGPAFTMRYIPSREDIDGTEYGASPDNIQRQAIDTIPAGHVLVMDCRGLADTAGIGAVLARRLVFRGAAGVLLDGGVRDTADIAALGFPTFCLGPAIPANLVSHHASDMGLPVACGGVAVYPGDIVFGDGEGAVVIPPRYLDEIGHEAVAMEEQEVFLKREIESGKSTFGIYPPSEETVARYHAWRARKGDGLGTP